MNKLKEVRKADSRHLTQKDMADWLGIERSTYGKYEQGSSEPTFETICKLAEFFGVSIEYLMGRSSHPASPFPFPEPRIAEKVVTFPIIGEVAAGYDHIALEDWSGDTVDIPEHELHGRPRSDFFVLSVHGDSMYPDFREGDKVLVLKTPTLTRSGDIGVVMYDDDQATLKKVEYMPGEDWMRLVPINPMYPARTIEGADLERCHILGTPWLLIRNFAKK